MKTLVFCLCLLHVASVLARPWQPQDDAKTARDNQSLLPSKLAKLRDSSQLNSRVGVPRAAQYCIDAELLRIQDAVDIDDQTFIKLRVAAQEDVARLTKIFTDKVDTREFKSPDVTDVRVIEQLWERAREILPKPTRRKLESYISQARPTYAISTENGKRGALLILENHLSLTPRQLDELEDLFEASWKEHWNLIPALALFNSSSYLTCIVKRLDRQTLKSILTADQLKVIDNLDMCGGNCVRAPSERKLDETRETMRFRMNLEIQRLKTIFQLDDSQTNRLRIASKGVVNRVILPAKASEPFAHPKEPVIYRLTRQPLWKKSVSRILTDEQTKRAEELELESAARFRKHLVIKLAIYTFGQAECGFTMQDHQDFVSMLNSKLPQTVHRDFSQSFGCYFKLDEHVVGAALPEEVWSRYKAEFLRRKLRE